MEDEKRKEKRGLNRCFQFRALSCTGLAKLSKSSRCAWHLVRRDPFCSIWIAMRTGMSSTASRSLLGRGKARLERSNKKEVSGSVSSLLVSWDERRVHGHKLPALYVPLHQKGVSLEPWKKLIGVKCLTFLIPPAWGRA